MQGFGGQCHVAGQRLDRADRAADAALALTGADVGSLGHLRGRGGIARHLFDRSGQFGNGGHGLIEFPALSLQTAAGVLGHRAQDRGSRVELFGGIHHLADGAAQVRLHALQGLQQTRRFIHTGGIEGLGQVALGDSLGRGHGHG
ncbi:hypothetical protein D3C84_898590 [compost metagenome]